MDGRLKRLIAGAVGAAIGFAGFISFALYAAYDEPNIGAALLSLLCLGITVGCVVWWTIECVLYFRQHRKLRGFAVISGAAAPSDGDTPIATVNAVAVRRTLPRGMRLRGRAAVTLVTLACLILQLVSVYPGVLNDLALSGFFLLVLIGPIVLLGGVVAFLVLWFTNRIHQIALPWGSTAIVLAIVLGTYVSLKFYLPRRIAFSLSRQAFRQAMRQMPTSEFPQLLNRRLGIYQVDEYAADPRGGFYFRVYRGRDGIGPDTMSYGFVYQPNGSGTPFGAARYRLYRLGNGWCWFRASNDWH